MKLSVVTCTYNSEKFLKQTLDSIWNQDLTSGHRIEHIILDAFSQDKTQSIAEDYKKNTLWRIDVKIEQRPPKWIFNAFNEWVKLATGDYVLVLPSDDFFEPNTLNDYLDFIEKTGSKDIYYARRNTFDNETWENIWTPYPNKEIYYHGMKLWTLWLSCYVSHPAMILKRQVHDRFGYYNENLKLVSDWEFYIKLTKWWASSQFYDKVVSNFRVHEWSATTGKVNPQMLWIQEENYVFRKYYGIPWFFFILVRKWLRIYFKLTWK